MSKRRRDNDDDVEGVRDAENSKDALHHPELSREAKRLRRHLTSVIEDGAQQLFHAMRFARGFERQKLGRRQKSAKKKEDPEKEAERLEAEVAALKKIPLAELAEAYLCRQLLKAQNIADHEALPRFVLYKAGTEQPRDAAYVNVASRLYKSVQITKCLERVVRNVRGVLGLRQAEMAAKKRRKRKADYEAEANGGSDKTAGSTKMSVDRDVSVVNGSQDGADTQADRDEHEAFDGFENDEEEPEIDGQDYDSAENDAYGSDQYDARLASSSDDDDDEELETEGLTNGLELPTGLQREDIAMAAESETDYSDEGEGLPRRVATGSKVDTSTSSFLPTLNAGYISGSDSDASDISALAPPRKNRMGQRARQALWEKKYGNKARHIKRGEPSVRDRDRDQGWDLKRGAQESGSGGRWGRDARGGRFGRDFRNERGGRHGPAHRTGANGEPVRERADRKPRGGGSEAPKTPTYGKEHPSWVARQAAKTKQSAAVRPSGQKITFN